MGSDNQLYRSTSNTNVGNDPTSSPFFWHKVVEENDLEGIETDIYASDGTSKILEHGTDGTDATFTGTAKGSLIDVKVFTSSGTWTMPSGTTAIEVWVVGGGGGGQGVASSATGAGGGGGGGGAVYKYFTSGFTSSEAVTVGAGGAGGTSGSNGSLGGTSTFLTIQCLGGNGGGSFGGGGGATTILGGTEVNISGGFGGSADTFTATNTYNIFGAGGGTGFGFGIGGQGGINEGASSDGTDGTGYGGGGGGAFNDGVAVDRPGGNGSGGIVIVKSYK
jgi:hypothetical protein